MFASQPNLTLALQLDTKLASNAFDARNYNKKLCCSLLDSQNIYNCFNGLDQNPTAKIVQELLEAFSRSVQSQDMGLTGKTLYESMLAQLKQFQTTSESSLLGEELTGYFKEYFVFVLLKTYSHLCSDQEPGSHVRSVINDEKSWIKNQLSPFFEVGDCFKFSRKQLQEKNSFLVKKDRFGVVITRMFSGLELKEPLQKKSASGGFGSFTYNTAAQYGIKIFNVSSKTQSKKVMTKRVSDVSDIKKEAELNSFLTRPVMAEGASGDSESVRYSGYSSQKGGLDTQFFLPKGSFFKCLSDEEHGNGKAYISLFKEKGDDLFSLIADSVELDLDIPVLKPDGVAEYLRELCKQLEVIWEKGYEHLDIKPDNLVYDKHSDTLRLIDLGLAQKNSFVLKKGRLYATPVFQTKQMRRSLSEVRTCSLFDKASMLISLALGIMPSLYNEKGCLDGDLKRGGLDFKLLFNKLKERYPKVHSVFHDFILNQGLLELLLVDEYVASTE